MNLGAPGQVRLGHPQHLVGEGRDVARAREEILLETYIMRDDRLGSVVQRALVAAAQRGVRVCVLADAVGSLATGDRFWETLEAGGVTVRLFHRVWHHPLEALRRRIPPVNLGGVGLDVAFIVLFLVVVLLRVLVLVLA